MVSYRPFHNADPPKLIRLWHAAELGRGAAAGFDADAFEESVFSMPYFDRDGLIVAVEGDEDDIEGEVVGFAHAGFGMNADGSGLDHALGILCVVVVRPDHRRQGIGTELVRRAEAYLADHGATTIQAGAAPPHEPFYIGLYGGSRPAGFLESDAAAAPFVEALGYSQHAKHLIFQRDLAKLNDPVSIRLVGNRRSTQLVFMEDHWEYPWSWMTRVGRYEPICGVLTAKADNAELAEVVLLDLHFYAAKWEKRGVGLLRLLTAPDQRRNGYAQSLLIELSRRLRKELVTLLEIHTPESNAEAVQTFESAGFTLVDAGWTYRKGES